MIQIHICEDSEHQLIQICKLIKDACVIVSEDMRVVTATAKPEEILDNIGKNNEINIYFLDIDLNHKTLNGFQIAVQIRKKEPFAYICFVTTHSEMSFLTFKYKVMAFDFIIKDTFESMKNDILSCLKAINQQIHCSAKKEEFIELDLFHEKRMIPINSILAVDTVGNHKIRMYTDTQTIEMSRTLSNIKKELPPFFIKCHKSVIINGKKIIAFDTKTGKLTLNNGQQFYAAIRKVREISQFMDRMQ